MSVSVPSRVIENYVNQTRNWDAESRRELVNRLLAVQSEQPETSGSVDLFGTWEDDRTADEIVADIYNSRISAPNGKYSSEKLGR